ncbi:hypothetical protein KC343_g4327 [Hortaea werneckii]|uniref:Dyp-type peroxidase n=1 Tax=Hortaea werneckii TaxID=91943 RepID=A0A3M7E5K9_HORWE|nr:hypothetical protein KC352_g14818 [Hortaea werneckii]KAI7563522.1 hypothetical protein KC317_g7673 [Hortaea werneckii]KAI7612480.1 hypothetical protein KC346_g7807 [Hortaea werneckii]KAI7630943.1 hypothetical protein KC343_g4327 [Hortaea werneckii]KAI7664662.1 hypothetical protein KC319_g7414 [Hortaea werneckii]
MASPGKLQLDNIQGDILLNGLPKKAEIFLFFEITDPKTFCSKLKQVADEIAHTAHTSSSRDKIGKKDGPGIVDMAGANIAFSFRGLQKMAGALANLDLKTQDAAFEAGMKKGAASLHDPLKAGSTSEPAWEEAFGAPQNLHGVLFAAGSAQKNCQEKLDKVKSILGASMKVIATVSGKVRPGEMKGHEHFGFLDGISEPAVQGIDTSIPPGQDTIPQGVILCNRPGDSAGHPAWMTDGSFLCFRKLKQNVSDWNKFLVDASNQLGTWSDQLGARLIGRWKSGCPVELSPEFDDAAIGADVKRNNKFEFTPNSNFKCPFGAHIRKMNPRGDLGRGVVNQFRVLRRGIPYGEELKDDPNGERGLLFVCYQSNISQGFQFLQQTWANAPRFRVEGAGLDAVMGQDNNNKTVDMKGLFPQNKDKPLALSGINRFVVPKGGEYFFSPSMSALRTTLSTLKAKSDL